MRTRDRIFGILRSAEDNVLSRTELLEALSRRGVSVRDADDKLDDLVWFYELNEHEYDGDTYYSIRGA